MIRLRRRYARPVARDIAANPLLGTLFRLLASTQQLLPYSTATRPKPLPASMGPGSLWAPTIQRMGWTESLATSIIGRLDYAAPYGKDLYTADSAWKTRPPALQRESSVRAAFQGMATTSPCPTRDFVLHEAHTFNPTTVLEGLFSFFRAYPYISPGPTSSLLQAP